MPNTLFAPAFTLLYVNNWKAKNIARKTGIICNISLKVNMDAN